MRGKSTTVQTISVAGGTCGMAAGAGEVWNKFARVLGENSPGIRLELTGCKGFCAMEPVVTIGDIFYCRVRPSDVEEILEKTVHNGELLERLLFQDDGKTCETRREIPFYQYQDRRVLSLTGEVDPVNLQDYLTRKGFESLKKALKMKGEDIIQEVKDSGLRGRGGGGFPTGRKWESCRNSQADSVRYIICNGDEGDPGCFQDRSLMEGNPYLVLEGLIIGGYAIGAEQGYIYVRSEYPLAVKNLEIALARIRAEGFLGRNILDSGFDFDIEIVRGAGAFVCGESSALMASIEGKIGEPRVKHIHATNRGLWDKPTVLNNVKTLASIPLIIGKGAAWFSSIGTENSKGTMIFSLTGNIKNTGLVEVPMGITLRDLIYKIGGGIPGGKKFKAIQTGGPSGGCLPESSLDLPVDYEALLEAGSMMGSGGMVVMDEDTCMVRVAQYFLNFTREESCGKCPPCSEGSLLMLKILDKFIAGNADEDDLDQLGAIGRMVAKTSLCGLGKSAPNPVLTTLRYFKDEYQSHIKGICPAGACPGLNQ